jgi:hypothetical protein
MVGGTYAPAAPATVQAATDGRLLDLSPQALLGGLQDSADFFGVRAHSVSLRRRQW